jgi:hypothetical protein
VNGQQDDPIEKILSEAPQIDLLSEITISSRDHAYVQAVSDEKRNAQSKVVKMLLDKKKVRSV